MQIKEISLQGYNGVNVVVGLAEITNWWNETGITETIGFSGHIFGARKNSGGVYACNCNLIALVNDKKNTASYYSLVANNLTNYVCTPCIFTYNDKQYIGFKHRANRDYLQLSGYCKGLLNDFIITQESNATIEITA